MTEILPNIDQIVFCCLALRPCDVTPVRFRDAVVPIEELTNPLFGDRQNEIEHVAIPCWPSIYPVSAR